MAIAAAYERVAGIEPDLIKDSQAIVQCATDVSPFATPEESPAAIFDRFL